MFSPQSSIEWPNRYEDVCGEGWGVRKKRWGGHHSKAMLNLPVSERHVMNVSSFCLDRGRNESGGGGSRVPETWATLLGDNPERTAPLIPATGSEWGGRHALIYKCLLHTLNGCGPWWIFSPDALSMRLTLCIIASVQTERALSPISLFSASLT